jgi:hypothetical protein
MLKIKDDYDLDGLKKYGFKHIFGIGRSNETADTTWWDYWKYETYYTEYTIYPDNREIYLYGSDEYTNDIDTLYNMIIDGIVEKVVE